MQTQQRSHQWSKNWKCCKAHLTNSGWALFIFLISSSSDFWKEMTVWPSETFRHRQTVDIIKYRLIPHEIYVPIRHQCKYLTQSILKRITNNEKTIVSKDTIPWKVTAEVINLITGANFYWLCFYCTCVCTCACMCVHSGEVRFYLYRAWTIKDTCTKEVLQLWLSFSGTHSEVLWYCRLHLHLDTHSWHLVPAPVLTHHSCTDNTSQNTAHTVHVCSSLHQYKTNR